MSQQIRTDLFARPALLFLPASNARAIVKARGSAADLVILDLEDAVKPEDKVEAREAARAAVSKTWVMPVGIRVNAGDERDLAMVLDSRCDFVVFPMVEHPVEPISKPALAMIETPLGVVKVHEIAASVCGLIVGTNDLSAGLKLPKNDRNAMQYALQRSVLAARAAGIAVFDGVFNRLDDAEGLASECAESRALGFDGKSLIHPDQIGPCQAAFAPSAAELARAERLVAAASGGAERFEGAMIEDMHVESARRLLARQ
jgi:citrate lyase subunit beta/citryl-CoA lyase